MFDIVCWFLDVQKKHVASFLQIWVSTFHVITFLSTNGPVYYDEEHNKLFNQHQNMM